MKILILIAAGLADGAGGVVNCPPLVEIEQKVVAVEGWSAHEAQTPHRFYFAQFSDGPPSRQATLMYDRESRSGKHKLLHYRFTAAQEPWLVCSYTGTNAVLARRLAPGTRACSVTLDHARNFETVKGISCEE